MTTSAIQRNMFSAQTGIFLTGATGFLGGAVMDASNAADWQPLALGDVPEGTNIIHLAANVSGTNGSLAENIALDLEIVDLADRTRGRLVYASGNHLYPFALNCRVGDTLRPVGNYALSKYVGELLVADRLGSRGTICRLPDIFGVGQRHGNFFRALEQALRVGSEIQQFGSGMKRRTYLHVDDAAAAMVWFADQTDELSDGSSRIWNLGYTDSASVVEILDFVSAISGLPKNYVSIDQDESWRDVRTMDVVRFPNQIFKFESFRDALSGYVQQLVNPDIEGELK